MLSVLIFNADDEEEYVLQLPRWWLVRLRVVDFTAAGNANADVAGRERWAAEITSDTTARLHCRSLCVIIVLMSYVSCEL